MDKKSKFINKYKNIKKTDEGMVMSRSSKKKEKVTMDKDEFIKEHKRLISVLRSPSHKDDVKEADSQAKELAEHTEKADNNLPCGCGLAGKICRHNKKKLNKSDTATYDFKDTGVTVNASLQHSAETTASPELIDYIKASINNSISKIPFAKGTLTLSQKDNGIYDGFFQDREGQIVDRYENMTPELVAKNMEVKNFFNKEANNTEVDKEIAEEAAEDVVHDAMEAHNEMYHAGQEPYAPVKSGKGYVKIKYGDFELEIKKSISNFVNDFKKSKQSTISKEELSKAIKTWRRNYKNKFGSEMEAARALLKSWDQYYEEFQQMLFASKQNGQD